MAKPRSAARRSSVTPSAARPGADALQRQFVLRREVARLRGLLERDVARRQRAGDDLLRRRWRVLRDRRAAGAGGRIGRDRRLVGGQRPSTGASRERRIWIVRRFGGRRRGSGAGVGAASVRLRSALSSRCSRTRRRRRSAAAIALAAPHSTMRLEPRRLSIRRRRRLRCRASRLRLRLRLRGFARVGEIIVLAGAARAGVVARRSAGAGSVDERSALRLRHAAQRTRRASWRATASSMRRGVVSGVQNGSSSSGGGGATTSTSSRAGRRSARSSSGEDFDRLGDSGGVNASSASRSSSTRPIVDVDVFGEIDVVLVRLRRRRGGGGSGPRAAAGPRPAATTYGSAQARSTLAERVEISRTGATASGSRSSSSHALVGPAALELVKLRGDARNRLLHRRDRFG